MEDKIKQTDPERRYRRVLSASSLAGDSVRNAAGEDLGKVDEIMIDIPSGRVAYAVLSFGGFLRMGNKLFAVPWEVLTVDEDRKCFILDVDKATLKLRLDLIKTTGPVWLNRLGAMKSTAITDEHRIGIRKRSRMNPLVRKLVTEGVPEKGRLTARSLVSNTCASEQ